MTLPKPVQAVIDFTKELFSNYGNDDAFTLGAALAYYTVFSFAPLLVLVISVTSFFIGPEAVRGELYDQLSGLLGSDAATTLEGIVQNAYISGNSLFAIAVGAGTLFFGATAVFAAIQNALNKIWQIEPRPKSNILAFVKARAKALSFVLVLGFLLLVTLAIDALVSSFGEQISGYLFGVGPLLIEATTQVLSLLVTTIIFALIFRFLPDARPSYRDVFAGALFTALLFAVGRWAIGFYIGNSDFGSTYGAAAALITLLVWTFYSSQILFLGAEFSFVWAKWHGRRIKPKPYAVRVVRKAKSVEEG